MPEEKDVDGVIRDARKTVEVSLPDAGETVRLGKLRYAQMKDVTRKADNWERNDASILSSLANAGNVRTQEWLDNLSTDDVMVISNAFTVLSGAPISVEDWLKTKYPKILADYQKEVEAQVPRVGSNPLRRSSMTERASPSFG